MKVQVFIEPKVSYTFSVNDFNTIKSLKHSIFDKLNIPTNKQQLIHNRTFMEDNNLISNYDLHSNNIIYLIQTVSDKKIGTARKNYNSNSIFGNVNVETVVVIGMLSIFTIIAAWPQAKPNPQFSRW